MQAAVCVWCWSFTPTSQPLLPLTLMILCPTKVRALGLGPGVREAGKEIREGWAATEWASVHDWGKPIDKWPGMRIWNGCCFTSTPEMTHKILVWLCLPRNILRSRIQPSNVDILQSHDKWDIGLELVHLPTKYLSFTNGKMVSSRWKSQADTNLIKAYVSCEKDQPPEPPYGLRRSQHHFLVFLPRMHDTCLNPRTL